MLCCPFLSGLLTPSNPCGGLHGKARHSVNVSLWCLALLSSKSQRNGLEAAAPPLPCHFSFLFFCWKTLAADSWGDGKAITWIKASIWWELQTLWHLLTKIFFQAFQRVHPYPPSPFSFPALISSGARRVEYPPECTLYLPALIFLTKAFRKRLLEISKI